MECPFCGGEITRVKISSAAGVRAFSLCCDAPLELIDNFEVFSALPEPLQQAALDRAKAEHQAIIEEEQRRAKAFRENYDYWVQHRPELFKGERAELWL